MVKLVVVIVRAVALVITQVAVQIKPQALVFALAAAQVKALLPPYFSCCQFFLKFSL